MHMLRRSSHVIADEDGACSGPSRHAMLTSPGGRMLGSIGLQNGLSGAERRTKVVVVCPRCTMPFAALGTGYLQPFPSPHSAPSPRETQTHHDDSYSDPPRPSLLAAHPIRSTPAPAAACQLTNPWHLASRSRGCPSLRLRPLLVSPGVGSSTTWSLHTAPCPSTATTTTRAPGIRRPCRPCHRRRHAPPPAGGPRPRTTARTGPRPRPTRSTPPPHSATASSTSTRQSRQP